MHPLDDADLWISRADEHLTNLNRILAPYINAYGKALKESHQANPQATAGVFVRAPDEEVPKMASILLGEFIQALRRGLDYMVHQLAILDSGVGHKYTQFPIEDTEKGFWRRRQSYLKGVNDSHVTAIQRLQPYKGVNWTKTLALISNQDKHRRLILATGYTEVSSHSGNPTAIPGTAVIPFTNLATGKVEMYVRIAPYIIFEGGLPVKQTLHELKSGVVDTVDAFKSEFERG